MLYLIVHLRLNTPTSIAPFLLFLPSRREPLHPCRRQVVPTLNPTATMIDHAATHRVDRPVLRPDRVPRILALVPEQGRQSWHEVGGVASSVAYQPQRRPEYLVMGTRLRMHLRCRRQRRWHRLQLHSKSADPVCLVTTLALRPVDCSRMRKHNDAKASSPCQLVRRHPVVRGFSHHKAKLQLQLLDSQILVPRCYRSPYRRHRHKSIRRSRAVTLCILPAALRRPLDLRPPLLQSTLPPRAAGHPLDTDEPRLKQATVPIAALAP